MGHPRRQRRRLRCTVLGWVRARIDRGHRIRSTRRAAGRARQATAGEIAAGSLPTSTQAFRTVADANAERQARQIVVARAAKGGGTRRRDGPPWPRARAGGQRHGEPGWPPRPIPDPGRQIYLNEAKARIDAALVAEIGFAERLVWFWSNHFCISADKIQSMSGAYEREADPPSRPWALSPTCCRPPRAIRRCCSTSTTRRRWARTRSPASIARAASTRTSRAKSWSCIPWACAPVYTQDDVIRFANVLTGWTLLPAGDNPEHGGEFTFNRRLHEPGPQRSWTRSTRIRGVEQGRAVLATWPRIPSTAKHVADQAGHATSLPTSRPRRWSRSWRRPSAIPPAI